MLTVRQSTSRDIDRIMEIYARAKRFMADNGNPRQWSGPYPQRERVEADVAAGISHVLVDEAGGIAGTFCFIIGPDPTYSVIEGEWPDDEPYGTIHRIASAGTARGVADAALSYCQSKISTIRIDTHEDNTPMRGWILRSGFRYCGIIYTDNGSPRLAYQLRIK